MAASVASCASTPNLPLIRGNNQRKRIQTPRNFALSQRLIEAPALSQVLRIPLVRRRIVGVQFNRPPVLLL